MRLKRALVVGGLVTALAGVTAVSAAERVPVHVLTVQLPGGGVEEIHYVGDTPPRVLVGDAVPAAAPSSLFDVAFGPDSPFADLDRISAEMDRQAAQMMQQVSMAQQAPAGADGQLQPAALAGAPAGVTSITTVSTSNAKGVCTQSIRTVSMGEGKAPQVTRTAQGACDVKPTAAKPATPTPPAPPVAPAKPAPIDRDTI